ncbi:GPI-anchored protein [Wolffia australiana]
MENSIGIHISQSALFNWLIIFFISIFGIRDVLPQETTIKTDSHAVVSVKASLLPKGLLGPIDISPAVIPHDQYPIEPQSPMYPSFPSTYDPILTGRCQLNFSNMASIIDKTASDCSAPLASLVGNVICCPQVNSLVHILQGTYGKNSGSLVLQQAAAEDCFSDIMSILASRGANDTIPGICSIDSAPLTGGSCPVQDVETFEKTVNTSLLLDSCSTVDPLKECCRPICQPAIMEAAVRLSQRESSPLDNAKIPGKSVGVDVLSDCKGIVYSWLSQKLSLDDANAAFRMLSSCKVNKVCPLQFKDPSTVIKDCRDPPSANSSCCNSLDIYISDVQKQMLITNRQAINCAMFFGSLLQKGGVVTNVYDLCNIDLKDFSLQAYRQQGCLLRSLPADVLYDNYTGYSFTCDLSDNIGAPWPSSSSLSSLSLCAPEMSLPALPVSQNSRASGGSRGLGLALTLVLSSLSYTQRAIP